MQTFPIHTRMHNTGMVIPSSDRGGCPKGGGLHPFLMFIAVYPPYFVAAPAERPFREACPDGFPRSARESALAFVIVTVAVDMFEGEPDVLEVVGERGLPATSVLPLEVVSVRARVEGPRLPGLIVRLHVARGPRASGPYEVGSHGLSGA